MGTNIEKVGRWLQRRAEDVLVLMLATMFVAFLIQIVFRYFFNLPTGWSTELTVACWLWMVLWGAAFVLRDDEEIRLDLIYSAAPPRVARWMAAVVAVSLIGFYAIALPGTWSYVSFMAVERTAFLRIRVDHMYSIMVIFLVAVILRQLWALWRLFRGPASHTAAGAP
jgi:TRAP-type C4-dicarboxylate transport system permease small subunit